MRLIPLALLSLIHCSPLIQARPATYGSEIAQPTTFGTQIISSFQVAATASTTLDPPSHQGYHVPNSRLFIDLISSRPQLDETAVQNILERCMEAVSALAASHGSDARVAGNRFSLRSEGLYFTVIGTEDVDPPFLTYGSFYLILEGIMAIHRGLLKFGRGVWSSEIITRDDSNPYSPVKLISTMMLMQSKSHAGDFAQSGTIAVS